MTERTTPQERIERAKATAAASARRAGQSEGEVAAAVKLAGEVARDPRTQAVYARLESDEAARDEAERRAEVQRRNLAERQFSEELERQRLDRLSFYRQVNPGLSEADFNRHLWPKLRAQIVAGEEDDVTRTLRSRSTPVF